MFLDSPEGFGTSHCSRKQNSCVLSSTNHFANFAMALIQIGFACMLCYVAVGAGCESRNKWPHLGWGTVEFWRSKWEHMTEAVNV
jgi:hypothetical protein